jgi:hypothetical protein
MPADIVADTFLTAWRRLEDLPPEPAARLWLYGADRGGAVGIAHPGGLTAAERGRWPAGPARLRRVFAPVG